MRKEYKSKVHEQWIQLKMKFLIGLWHRKGGRGDYSLLGAIKIWWGSLSGGFFQMGKDYQILAHGGTPPLLLSTFVTKNPKICTLPFFTEKMLHCMLKHIVQKHKQVNIPNFLNSWQQVSPENGLNRHLFSRKMYISFQCEKCEKLKWINKLLNYSRQ